MLSIEPKTSWSLSEKIIFWFLFLFLGFFLLNYELAMTSIYLGFYKSLSHFYALFAPPLQWLDAHIYHTGYLPKVHESMPSDNHFGLVFYLTALIVFSVAALTCGFLDRSGKEYNKLYYWFRIYTRCMVALIMFGYGMDKLFPSQMSYPNVETLLNTIGNQSRYDTLWNFVGSSPPYEMFTGLCEVLGSILLIIPRTYVFGALFMCTLLCNVVALNFFYNIPVKLYSSLLLISVIFLLLPHSRKLIRFFFYGKTESLAEKPYRFERAWKRYLVLGIAVCIPLLAFIHSAYREYKSFSKYHHDIKEEKLYYVTTFILKDTLPPLLTDTTRWRWFAVPDKNTAAIFDMQGKANEYAFDMDTLKHTYRLHRDADTTKWDLLHYEYPQEHILEFTGKWKGNDVKVIMTELSVDSIKLNKDRIAFLND